MRIYAHTFEGRPAAEWQLLDAHLLEVAQKAAAFAEAFGAGAWGECAGLLHDEGKATQAFQDYLLRSVQGNAVRGSVPHAACGARIAADASKALGKLLAYAVAGHHGGLPDWEDLERRLRDAPPLDLPSPLADPVGYPEGFPFRRIGPEDNRPGFVLSFFTRMVFSCLVDADWLDTEAFMDREKSAWRGGYPDLDTLSGHFFPLLEAMVAKARTTAPTPVNRVRREVLVECLAAADLPPGLFSLTVPTGGGKTLSSLAFALRHAARHGLSRIVYVIPYMSIIEQNADVFRAFLGDDAVVEHHSSADPGDGEDESPARIRARLASENWDAPLIATTAVQFFESLFAAKPSRCRKLHNLARSVIILDEAQMLPRTLLLPCLAAIRELAARYGASVVLCTATQPALRAEDGLTQGLKGVREIMTDPKGLHERLRRVRVEDLGELDDEALAERLRGHRQVLCIVNTRPHARTLYELLEGTEGLAHLSANMTAAHRSVKIAAIKAALEEGRPCRVVATSLVEAGVDVDFPVVYRAAAGLDSIAQASGRCDREGRLTEAAGAPAGQVFVFTPKDGLPPGHFRITADTAAEVMRQGYPDLLAPEAVEHYFRLLFWQAGKVLDAKGIMKDLTDGEKTFSFPFRSLAESFRVIETDMRPIIVPVDEKAGALVRELEFTPSPGRILRKLQRHIVQVHPRAWQKLVDAGAARVVLEGLAVLENLDLYKKDLGLCPEDPSYREIERLLI